MTTKNMNAEDQTNLDALKALVLKTLDENKAEDVIDIDLHEKSTIADYMVVASGTSSRHVASLAQKVMEECNKAFPGRKQRAEGMTEGEWVLVDLQDIILHVFRPEVREFYSLEKMWSAATVGVEHKKMISKKSAE
jgi:ribosome-associated protein